MSPPSQREKILVVDDDLNVLDLVAKQALAPMGYQVVTAIDGASAIQKALQLQPDHPDRDRILERIRDTGTSSEAPQPG